MTRDEALQWCVKHVEEWPEGYTPQFAPKGWEWVLVISPGNRYASLMKIVNGGYITSSEIDRNHWMKASRRIEVQVNITNPDDVEFLRKLHAQHQPDTTPCGQSFNELMKELQR